MLASRASTLAIAIGITGVAVAAARLAGAAPQQTPDLATNEGMFVDLKTFKIVRGVAKVDPTAQIMKLGARPVTEGLIIFRAGDKLYVVDAVPGGGTMALMFEGAFAPPGG
jgi:hypothetical protein